MQISYSLYPGFLQTEQAGTRRILEGIVVELEEKKVETAATEVHIFSATDLVQPEKSAKIGDLPEVAPIALATTIPPAKPVKTQVKAKIRPVPSKLARSFKKRRTHALFQWGLTGTIVAAIAVALVVLTPNLYYKLFPADTVPIEAATDGTPIGGTFQKDELEPAPTSRPLPPQDPTLPTGTWLSIPRIGVRTELKPGEDQETALKNGVWLVPEYGRPGDVTQPVILAAHRYGWQWWWQTDYWKYHSFYNLPELEPGDIVEVIDDQRKYYYEIYAGEEGEEITDYSADMILYTCKFLSSPLRHFRYARIIDMEKDTQASESVNQAG